MFKKILTLVSIMLFSSMLFSQNESDALRYSQLYFGGTARNISMAGSFNALGADLSTTNSNPAGIGLFRSSELVLSPSLGFSNTTSTYLNVEKSDHKADFLLNNLGLVLVNKNSNSNPLKATQFAISFNKLTEFNQRSIVEGFNSKNSITDMFVEMANGIGVDEIADENGYHVFDLYPAWQTYMIEQDSSSIPNQYYSYIVDGNVLQQQKVLNKGSITELDFSFGSNIMDKLYLGITVGVPMVNYQNISTYYEKDEDHLDYHYDFKELQIRDELYTEGSGVNVKFGMIYQPVKFLRIGGAIHSPTWYAMKDSWSSEYLTKWAYEPTLAEQKTPDGYYDYNIETPWRAIGSLGFIISKKALLNFDYEFVDYSSAILRAETYDFFDENDAIVSNFRAANNFRAGGEYRIGNMALRGGYAYYGSPYEDLEIDGSRSFYTGGIGFRLQKFYLDMAYMRSVTNKQYYLYNLISGDVPSVDQSRYDTQFVITTGFKF